MRELSVTKGESVSIEAYSVDCISQIRNEHVKLRKMDYSHLKGLWFLDVCKDKEVLDIEVLMGADYHWWFQEGNVVWGQADEPVSVSAKLGWVLSSLMKARIDLDNMHTQVNFITHESSGSLSLDKNFNRLWDFETLGIAEEDEVHESLRDSIMFNGN